MVVPEINADHLADIIEAQTKAPWHEERLYRRQAELLHPELCARADGAAMILSRTTRQSCAPIRRFPARARRSRRWPEMVDNVIPYIGGEEREERAASRSKLWGHVEDGVIVHRRARPIICAQCVRVAVRGRPSGGGARASFKKKPATMEADQGALGVPIETACRSSLESAERAARPSCSILRTAHRPQTRLGPRLSSTAWACRIGRLRGD